MKRFSFESLNLHLHVSANRCSSAYLHQVEANPRLGSSEKRSEQELETEQMSLRGSDIKHGSQMRRIEKLLFHGSHEQRGAPGMAGSRSRVTAP